MEFRVLGPVEAFDGGRRIAVPGGRARVVLAMLVWQANSEVSVDRLVDSVWDGDPPMTARTQLHGHVSSLRRALAAGSVPRTPTDDVLVTQGSGYRLNVEPADCDLVVFRDRVSRARAAIAAGGDAAAVEDLAQALALWHGRAFEGTRCLLLDAEARRLDQELLRASAEYAEVLLRLGRHADAAPALARLVEQQPFQEELRGLYMLALYRCGRRADALAVYRHGRQVLAEELGVEPGSAISELHRRMLSGDPGLDAAVQPPPVGVGVPTPAQLPADIPDFTGRAKQVKELTDLLSADPRADRHTTVAVATISGAGGIGKSALAIHIAQRLRGRFPDGQLYADLRGASSQPLSAHEVLARFLRALGVDGQSVPAEPEERAARYRSLLADRRVLVVLDDARDAAQVHPLLPATAGCAVLVTSRHYLTTLPASSVVDLGVLETGESSALLARIVGPQRAAAEQAAVADVVAACSGLPLAVRIAGNRLASRPGWTVRSLADRLTDQHRGGARITSDGWTRT